MNNLRKFSTEADYSAATLNYPAVSWVTATDNVYFDKSAPTPSFSGLTVYYNIPDISESTELFNGGGGSGSGSGSGSGGVLPSAMIIDGTAVEVTNTYQFSTTGEHIVNYSFELNEIPEHFLDDESTGRFSTVSKVEIGNAITSIGNNAFVSCTGLTSCTIGSGSIGDEAFVNCRSLTSCTLGSGVTNIGNNAFVSCSGLTNVVIPDSVTSIGFAAFQYCSGLTSCTIGSGSIGDYVFYECSSLTSCTIGSGVTSIGNGAFNNCTSLTSITSNAITAPSLDSGVFSDISYNGVLTVPSGSQGYCDWTVNLPGGWTIEGVTCE